jgi:phospholipase C
MQFFTEKIPRGSKKLFIMVTAFLLATTTLAACGGSSTTNLNSNSGIHKIQHIIVIMQENRSFDTYFGTFPGADGIPMQKGASQPMAGLL